MNFFASAIAIPTLEAEPILKLGPIAIRNSQLLGIVTLILLSTFFILVARQAKVRPSKNPIVGLIEMACEYVLNLMAEVMHSRRKAIAFAPLILTLFFVIMFNNWTGLLPGVGHAITTNTHDGAVPLLRGFNSDLNNTLAMAIVTMVMVQVYAIKELRPLGYLKHFFSDKPYNPINLFVGVLEVIGEFTKMMSLSLRLFGNVFAGEVLLLVIGTISGYLAPVTTLPFVLMEIFVGFIQAFVFAMLAIVYLAISTDNHETEHTAPTIEESQPSPVLMKTGAGVD